MEGEGKGEGEREGEGEGEGEAEAEGEEEEEGERETAAPHGVAVFPRTDLRRKTQTNTGLVLCAMISEQAAVFVLPSR